MPDGRMALPPTAWKELIKRTPKLFSRSAVPGVELPTAAMLDDLSEIHHDINRKAIWTPDSETYGKRDWWAPLRRHGRYYRGDCEDYAISYREAAIKAGWAREALRLCLCILPKAESPTPNRAHMVLTADIHRDTLVLDCLRERVMGWQEYGWGLWAVPWSDAGHWLTREHPGSFMWRRVEL